MKSSRVYLSIGSNIGDRESNIAQAISALEVSEKNSSDFEKMLNKNKCSYKHIGKTNDSNKIVVKNFIDLNINQTKKIWENALRKKLQ